MEVMFYIIDGKFNPSNDDFPVKTLITKDKFADKYAQNRDQFVRPARYF